MASPPPPADASSLASSPQKTTMPVTPTVSNAEIPSADSASGCHLTPPPSAQPRDPQQNAAKTPLSTATHLSSPPLTALALPSSARRELVPPSDQETESAVMSEDELRAAVTRLSAALHEAKTTAAHYKLQHQMSEMESGEAVERMAVEMEMARREIEVLQQADAQRKYGEQSKQAAQNHRQIHNDVYAAMIDEIRDLKLHESHLERELARAKQVMDKQEGEIASLKDKVSLMQDRIRESREQMFRYRRAGTAESTPRTVRHNPYQTPSSGRFRAINEAAISSVQQPGFAALLEASDMVRGHARGDSARSDRNAQPFPSIPATPTRQSAKHDAYALYTPQPPRQERQTIPNTAPPARKRALDETTPTRRTADHDSDGTVSADDSEAETEVADGDVGASRASRMAREMLRSPTRQIKRAKSAYSVKSIPHGQLFATGPPPPLPPLPSMLRQDRGERERKAGENSA